MQFKFRDNRVKIARLRINVDEGLTASREVVDDRRLTSTLVAYNSRTDRRMSTKFFLIKAASVLEVTAV